jgi:RNA polymerase sigma-70 factor (ECF subfamily)
MLGGGAYSKIASGFGAAEMECTDESVDEKELVERAKTQPQVFGQLYEIYYTRILNYLYHRVLDAVVAEELTSNTFFKALRALSKFDNRGKFGPWLYRIANNEIKLHRRSRSYRHKADFKWREELSRVIFKPAGIVATEDVEDKMREFAKIHAALDCLSEQYQAVITLRYFDAMSYDDIAQVLGKKIGTIKSLIHRGMERLKCRLEADGATVSQNLHYCDQLNEER